MRLERLEATQRPEKLKAVFDGETLTVSASLCVQFSLCAGMELDEEAFSALKAAVAKEAARERAVRILTASAVSERELEKREQAAYIRKAVLALREPEREIFLRYYYFYQPVSTIAEEMGLESANVKTKLFRGRKKLKEVLEKGGYFVEA